MERMLAGELVEGEIGLVIDYRPGVSPAVETLAGAMQFILALDKLDTVLLPSIDTTLEPVSILNDVQHSSLKILLARVLKSVPDESLQNLEWRKWIGNLLVKGKYLLLSRIDEDAPAIGEALETLAPEYAAAPGELCHYQPPAVAEVIEALESVTVARNGIHDAVCVQTELGDIVLTQSSTVPPAAPEAGETLLNTGIEFFKVKSPDMLGSAQWTVIRGNKNTRVEMLHKGWLEAYHARQHAILPGDSLKCRYQEKISYSTTGVELERKLSIIEVLEVISPQNGEQIPLPM
ncbi:MAG: hypothetical protein LBJ59_09105 [Zoogloeaceae bacterium]|nr:hypothetical protein [Zoogloeaceae bacterium]